MSISSTFLKTKFLKVYQDSEYSVNCFVLANTFISKAHKNFSTYRTRTFWVRKTFSKSSGMKESFLNCHHTTKTPNGNRKSKGGETLGFPPLMPRFKEDSVLSHFKRAEIQPILSIEFHSAYLSESFNPFYFLKVQHLSFQTPCRTFVHDLQIKVTVWIKNKKRNALLSVKCLKNAKYYERHNWSRGKKKY